MTQKDKYLFAELGLTLFLLITAVFLLKEAAFFQYRQFLIWGLVVGFAFGWYNRKGAIGGMKYFTNAAVLITVAWIGHRIFTSSFLYKEVIAIFIQGTFILEVILSLNFSAPEQMAYIRLLSIPIFMGFPVFTAAYNIPLAIAYLLIWLAILRFQFFGFLQPIKEKGRRRYYSLTTSIVCFLAALFLAWLIFSNIYLGRIKKAMFLPEEELRETGEGENEASVVSGNEFYSLQDELQNKITTLVSKLDSYEKMYQAIGLLSALLKESTDFMEVNKAEVGLIDILRREGPGLEDFQQAITLTRVYLDKKIDLNLQKNKQEIIDNLKKYSLGIIERIKVASYANKIQQTNSYQQLQESKKALQETINNASLGEYAKKDLGALTHSLSSWKALEIYRRKIQGLEKRLQSFGEEIKSRVSDVISDIEHTEGLEDFKQTAKKIRDLKSDSHILSQKSGKDILRGIEEAARLKLDLFFAEKAGKIRKEASKRQGSGFLSEGFDRKMDAAENAKDYQEFTKELSGLSQEDKKNNLGLSDELKEMLDLKTESFKQVEREKLDSLMDRYLSSEAKKEVAEALEEMEEKEGPKDLQNQSEALARKITDLQKKGSISRGNAEELLKAAGDFKDLLNSRLQAEAELKKEGRSAEVSQSYDYRGQLQQAIENSSLSSEEKDMLNSLSEELLKAQTLSQLEDIKEAMESRLSFLARKEIDTISEKIKEAVQIKQQFIVGKVLSDISEKTERLGMQDAKKAEALKEKLQEMRESSNPQELEKTILDLKKIVKTESAQEDKEGTMGREGMEQWKIYILPSPLVVSRGITVPLKVIAVYKKKYLKELTSDAEWFSSDQQVAWVDDLNFLHPLTEGRTKIRAAYKGIPSKDIEVTVVEKIDERTVQGIKQELPP